MEIDIDLFEKILLMVLGVAVGFGGNYILAIYRARAELKKEIAIQKVKYYVELWQLCDKRIDTENSQKERLEKLREWYFKGGGLFLSFKAAKRLLSAMDLLEANKTFDEDTLGELKDHLTWLRTELKFEVGSYNSRDKRAQLPVVKKS